MLVTVSENGSFDTYDLERWAARNRLEYTDSNRQRTTGTLVTYGNPPKVSTLHDPGGKTAGGEQFLQTTLPHDKVITDDPATRTLEGPKSAATPFIFDQ